MPNDKHDGHFDRRAASAYDERNAKFKPVSENLHFLIRLALRDLPADASILCVGVGTGADIIALAEFNPGWKFTGLDPSAPMLEQCRKRMEDRGLSGRTKLFRGFLHELPGEEKFDAVLCLLVAHFLRDERERRSLFEGMAKRLKPGGRFICAEISADLDHENYPDELEMWKAFQGQAGATEESLKQLPKLMKETLGLLPPQKTEEIIRQSGLRSPIQFFQSFLIRAWYARRA
jgi:tRNA (cmo5U34)-methyltransferase